MDELLDTLAQALVLILPVVAGILTILLKGYLAQLGEKAEGEIGEQRLHHLLAFADIFIRSAAQTAGLDTDHARKSYVYDLLAKATDDLGIEVDEDQLNALIEGVYNRIKIEINAGSRTNT